MKPKIVYVDDEWPNLNAFKAMFRHDYDVILADSAELALSLVQQHKPTVLLADQRLPNMTGVELLELVQATHPNTVRILVTGYDENRPLIDGINKGSIFYYLQKPWNNHQLSALLLRASQHSYNQNLIQNQNTELLKLVDELERFVYSISHDIRAPLMSVLGLIQITRLEPESAPRYLDYMEQSVHKLDTFIRSVIDHYKNLRTENTVRLIDLKALFALVIETQIPQTMRPEVNIKMDIDPTLNLYSDEFRLNLVLGNLVNNAAKYYATNQPYKQLDIKVRAEGNLVTFVIEDNGRGIADKHLGSIFNIFYRIAADNAGSGLGLYLVKETLNKMDGTINVASVLGQFTRFTITIPNGHESQVRG
jgi:signal transduction histidine kinase